MKILEKHNYDFEAQFEVTKKLHSLKCELLERDSDPYISYFRIKPEQIKPLFDSDYFKADYENNVLHICVEYDEDIFFEAIYEIDLITGVVRFNMEKPLILLKEFVIPAEFEDDLKERIIDLKNQGRLVESFNDERLDLYFSKRFLSKFIDFAGYMESLIANNKCSECIFNYLYQLKGTCSKFYTKNKCKG